MISINIETAKIIAHKIRRELRANEFLPLDDKISKQIPGFNFSDIELQRQVIRDKYSKIQAEIDASNDIESIKISLGL